MNPTFPQQPQQQQQQQPMQPPTMVTYQTVMAPVHGGMPPTTAAPAPVGYYIIQQPGNPTPGAPMPMMPAAVPAPAFMITNNPPPQGPQAGAVAAVQKGGEGGGDMFAHLRHIPMFPLSAASDKPNHVHSLPEAAYQVTRHIKVYKSVITRWACTPAGGGTILIDIYQLRNPFAMGRSPFRVHVSRDAQLRLGPGGKFEFAARRGRVWSKHFTKLQQIDEVVVVGPGGVAVPALMVDRHEETVAPEESEEVKSRFERWVIQA